MKVTATKDGITLRLSVDEALGLEFVLGSLSGGLARIAPSYDRIANVLEAHHLDGRTISHALTDAGYPYTAALRTNLEDDGVLRRIADSQNR